MMRKIIGALLALLMIATPAAQAQDIFDGGRLSGGYSGLSSDLLPASASELSEIDAAVDLERYSGKWYQVAAVPQPYSLQCAYDTTAEYAVLDESTISVKNTCGTLFGQSGIEGAASVKSQASLRVNFPGVPFQNEDGPTNYRVTYLADDYSLAIVGDPQRRSGFILSREQNLSQSQWAEVKALVEDRGYWPCAFVTVPMAQGYRDVTPLCAL